MKKLNKISGVLFLFIICLSCRGNASEEYHVPDSSQKSVPVEQASNTNDEKAFRQVLQQLKIQLKNKNLDASSAFLNFPFFTAKASEENSSGEAAVDPIAQSEYNQYKSDVFNTDILRLMPKQTEEQLSEIDEKTDDPYYRKLAKLTDKGSHLYEVYFQYPEKGTNAESFFGFVFGKIKGKYKAIAMYSKWPIK
ncbi:hypothetical protein [Pedobacter jejuensis]|uniref:hypothetical protein n=1 Tax=Pedobacter jejuensis TaxID=1268550 RepID=UPI0011CE5F29|nr:hypothetical protein [Pedobacter jejuensis]